MLTPYAKQWGEGSLAEGQTSSYDNQKSNYHDQLFLSLSYAKAGSHLSLQLLTLLCSLDDVVRLRQRRGKGVACVVRHLQSTVSQLRGAKPLD